MVAMVRSCEENTITNNKGTFRESDRKKKKCRCGQQGLLV